MSNLVILRLLAGFRRFKEKYFEGENPLFSRLSTGQAPRTLIIGCSDSRVDPAILSSASPGEIFVVRNVANLVPPYETGGNYHGVSAAIEFAVEQLQVKNIIVLGHRQCGGIRALMSGETSPQSFIGPWVRIAQAAREKVLSEAGDKTEEDLCRACETEAIKVSLANLTSFPFVQKALSEKRLELHGAYFDLELGYLYELDAASGSFRTLPI